MLVLVAAILAPSVNLNGTRIAFEYSAEVPSRGLARSRWLLNKQQVLRSSTLQGIEMPALDDSDNNPDQLLARLTQLEGNFKRVEANRRETLSTYDRISLCLQAIGLLSLILLVQQGCQMRATLESSATQALFDKTMDLDKVFIDAPELLPYFDDGTQIGPEHPLHRKATAVASFMIDLFDLLWAQSDHIPELKRGGPSWDAWEGFVAGSFKDSPILRERWDETKQNYSTDFQEFIDELIQDKNGKSRTAA